MAKVIVLEDFKSIQASVMPYRKSGSVSLRKLRRRPAYTMDKEACVFRMATPDPVVSRRQEKKDLSVCVRELNRLVRVYEVIDAVEQKVVPSNAKIGVKGSRKARRDVRAVNLVASYRRSLDAKEKKLEYDTAMCRSSGSRAEFEKKDIDGLRGVVKQLGASKNMTRSTVDYDHFSNSSLRARHRDILKAESSFEACGHNMKHIRIANPTVCKMCFERVPPGIHQCPGPSLAMVSEAKNRVVPSDSRNTVPRRHVPQYMQSTPLKPRPPKRTGGATSVARTCRFCGLAKGVVHGGQPCSRSKVGHRW